MELRELFDRFKHSNGKFGNLLVSFIYQSFTSFILCLVLVQPRKWS